MSNSAPLAVKCRVSWWRRLLVACTWFTVVLLGIVALLRCFYHDVTHVLTWFNALTRYIYLPAYACLAVAIWCRRPVLAVVSLAVVLSHLYWLAPDFMRDRRFESADMSRTANSGATRHLRIFFANVRILNREHDALIKEIEQSDPDIIVAVEFSGYWQAAFLRSSIAANYRYGSGLEQTFPGGTNIISKIPITADTQEWVASRCVETVDFQLNGKSLRLVGLHGPRPMDYRDNDYEGYWRHVLPLLLSERHPLVVVGDFNATQYSRVYQQLKSGGLRSAHEIVGRGYATSWPNGQEWVPPIRIDQAFISSDVVCRDIFEGQGLGSDHKPFVVDIELPD